MVKLHIERFFCGKNGRCPMYNIGDMVAYGAQGVCRVDEIASRQFGGAVMDYYILKPVFDSRSTISVPVANERLTARMRKPLDARQAGDVVDGIGEAQSLWISDDNLRRERYNAVIIDAYAVSGQLYLFYEVVFKRNASIGDVQIVPVYGLFSLLQPSQRIFGKYEI